MKKVILKIPEQKLDFFMELFRQLGIEVSQEEEIPEEHKAIVLERLKNQRPEDMIPWEEARKRLSFKGKT